MQRFEHQLKTITKYVQERLNPAAFLMYNGEFLTIASFDTRGGLQVIADVKHTEDSLYTFSQLYAQINQRLEDIRLDAERKA